MKRTIIDLFEESVQKYSDFTFLLEKDQDCYKPTSYKETKLIAKQFGVSEGAVRKWIKKGAENE